MWLPHPRLDGDWRLQTYQLLTHSNLLQRLARRLTRPTSGNHFHLPFGNSKFTCIVFEYCIFIIYSYKTQGFPGNQNGWGSESCVKVAWACTLSAKSDNSKRKTLQWCCLLFFCTELRIVSGSVLDWGASTGLRFCSLINVFLLFLFSSLYYRKLNSFTRRIDMSQPQFLLKNPKITPTRLFLMVHLEKSWIV